MFRSGTRVIRHLIDLAQCVDGSVGAVARVSGWDTPIPCWYLSNDVEFTVSEHQKEFFVWNTACLGFDMGQNSGHGASWHRDGVVGL